MLRSDRRSRRTCGFADLWHFVNLTPRLPTYLHAYISPPKGGNVCMHVGRWAGCGGNPLISAPKIQAAKPSQTWEILQSPKNWADVRSPSTWASEMGCIPRSIDGSWCAHHVLRSHPTWCHHVIIMWHYVWCRVKMLNIVYWTDLHRS